MTPVTAQVVTPNISHGSQTQLWGYYDVYVDVANKTATAILNRQAMFTANVVNLLNGKAASLSFHINGTPIGTGYIDVDIDVSITHPFPGLTQYNGYDVRGIFMGDGSAALAYNPKLKYAVLGADQYMLPDPTDSFGGPDGYTRWFNLPEFSGGGMPLFQYTQGKMASPGFAGTATLNPYKYFADNLLTTQDLWSIPQCKFRATRRLQRGSNQHSKLLPSIPQHQGRQIRLRCHRELERCRSRRPSRQRARSNGAERHRFKRRFLHRSVE